MPEAVSSEISIQTHPDRLPDVRKMVEDVCTKCRMGTDRIDRVVVTVLVAVKSIIEHAIDTDLKGSVEVLVDIDNDRFRAHIKDQTEPESVHNKRALETSREHSLGLFMMRKMMDEVIYTYKEGSENDLELISFHNQAS